VKRILLFVHFNKSNGLEDRVVFTLKSVRDLFDTVVVMSNSPLSNQDRQTLEGVSDKVIERENIGYDFSAWKEGLDTIGWGALKKYDSLTLMNDTCHFPILPIGPYYKKFERNPRIDFWGASIHKATEDGMPGTDEPVPEHIQSYFMSFKKKVFVSSVFKRFWDDLKAHKDVHRVIQDYETCLTNTLSSVGFKYDAIINTKNSVFAEESVVNPLYQLPERLLEQRFPFIKLKAVSKFNFINLREWAEQNSTYPSGEINPYRTSHFMKTVMLALNFMLKKAHITFLAISIPAIIAFAFLIPLGFGGDEAAHVYKTYSISQGHLFSVAGNVPKNLSDSVGYGWDVASEAPWGAQLYRRHDVSDAAAKQIKQLGDKKFESTAVKQVTYYNGASYPATVYSGAVLGFWVGNALDLSVRSTLILSRLLNAIPFLVFGALALYILRRSMAKWIVFTVLLVPTVISYAATINGDPYNIAVVALFFAVFLQCINNRHKITKKYLWLLTIISILLALAKLPSVLLVGLLFFIPKNRFHNSKDKWLKVGIMAALAILLTVLVTHIGYDKLPYRANSSAKISWVTSNPIDTIALLGRSIFIDSSDYLNRAVGVIGRDGVFVHPIIILMLFIWFSVLALSLEEMGIKKGLLLVFYATLLCATVIGLLFTGDPGNTINVITVWGVHGKYFTPFFPMIIYGLGLLAPFRITSNKNWVGLLTIALMVFVTITSILTYRSALY
jgi:uncharacterized membrane protein